MSALQKWLQGAAAWVAVVIISAAAHVLTWRPCVVVGVTSMLVVAAEAGLLVHDACDCCPPWRPPCGTWNTRTLHSVTAVAAVLAEKKGIARPSGDWNVNAPTMSDVEYQVKQKDIVATNRSI